MRNYCIELRWKLLVPTIFFNLYTKSPSKCVSKSLWRKRYISPTWNLEIKVYYTDSLVYYTDSLV